MLPVGLAGVGIDKGLWADNDDVVRAATPAAVAPPSKRRRPMGEGKRFMDCSFVMITGANGAAARYSPC
jgi:hypothetical protein